MFLAGHMSPGATLVAVSTLGAARWFAWTTASLVSQLPSARVWTRRTVAMTGVGAYSAAVSGVDLSAGTAPAPATAPRHPLRRLDLDGFSAVHEDGTVGVRETVADREELTIRVVQEAEIHALEERPASCRKPCQPLGPIAASWPHAAWMSRPRFRRTVVGMPARLRAA